MNFGTRAVYVRGKWRGCHGKAIQGRCDGYEKEKGYIGKRIASVRSASCLYITISLKVVRIQFVWHTWLDEGIFADGTISPWIKKEGKTERERETSTSIIQINSRVV